MRISEDVLEKLTSLQKAERVMLKNLKEAFIKKTRRKIKNDKL